MNTLTNVLSIYRLPRKPTSEKKKIEQMLTGSCRKIVCFHQLFVFRSRLGALAIMILIQIFKWVTPAEKITGNIFLNICFV